jgi:hypothetical protein
MKAEAENTRLAKALREAQDECDQRQSRIDGQQRQILHLMEQNTRLEDDI